MTIALMIAQVTGAVSDAARLCVYMYFPFREALDHNLQMVRNEFKIKGNLQSGKNP